MLYSRRNKQNNNCDLYSRVLSILIALHIIISLIVIGINQFNKNQDKKTHKIENGKPK